MAKVYLKAHAPQFCECTWSLVSNEVKHTYEGPTKARWEKFIRSEPVEGVLEKKLIRRPPAILSPCLIIPRQAFPPISFFVFRKLNSMTRSVSREA
jgi:hypothetical protein